MGFLSIDPTLGQTVDQAVTQYQRRPQPKPEAEPMPFEQNQLQQMLASAVPGYQAIVQALHRPANQGIDIGTGGSGGGSAMPMNKKPKKGGGGGGSPIPGGSGGGGGMPPEANSMVNAARFAGAFTPGI